MTGASSSFFRVIPRSTVVVQLGLWNWVRAEKYFADDHRHPLFYFLTKTCFGFAGSS